MDNKEKLEQFLLDYANGVYGRCRKDTNKTSVKKFLKIADDSDRNSLSFFLRRDIIKTLLKEQIGHSPIDNIIHDRLLQHKIDKLKKDERVRQTLCNVNEEQKKSMPTHWSIGEFGIYKPKHPHTFLNLSMEEDQQVYIGVMQDYRIFLNDYRRRVRKKKLSYAKS